MFNFDYLLSCLVKCGGGGTVIIAEHQWRRSCFMNSSGHNLWHGQTLKQGSGANGAIIHYRPEPDNCSLVDPKKLFSLNSGAQYIDGTMTITRSLGQYILANLLHGKKNVSPEFFRCFEKKVY